MMEDPMNPSTLTTDHVVNTPKGKLSVAKAYQTVTAVLNEKHVQFVDEADAAEFAELAVKAGNKFQAAAQVAALFYFGKQNEIDAAYAAGDITYAMWYGRTWRLRRAMLKDASLPRTYLNEKRNLQNA